MYETVKDAAITKYGGNLVNFGGSLIGVGGLDKSHEASGKLPEEFTLTN